MASIFAELKRRNVFRVGALSERPLPPEFRPFIDVAPMSASRPELFRQAISAIAGGFTKGDPRRFSALR